MGTRAPNNVASALQLLDILLQDYPHPTGLEQAYDAKARCLETLGRVSEALESYRLAFAARRATPNIRTYAPLNFGMFVVANRLQSLYDETQEVLNELVHSSDIIFPDAQYMYFGVSAIILARSGRNDLARDCAAKALKAASMQQSASARHPNIGLVKNRNKVIDAELQKIVHPGWLDRINNALIDHKKR